MANADSSWEASVVKLAQAGNARAIAFWMNRYLVPQGICAQVATEPSGCLQVRIVCRQMPDSDRVVRFICHRLCKLDSEMIQQVRITAQIVGSPTVLWEKSARILPPDERQVSPKKAKGNNIYPFPQAAQSPESQPPAVAIAEPPAAKSTKPASASPAKAAPVKSLPPKKVVRKRPPQAISQRPSQKRALFSQSWRSDLQGSFRNWQTNSLDLADRSIHWFGSQKPSTRAMMLGGSAVAAFLIGCSFELVGYYADPAALSQSKATLTGILRSVPVPSGSVKTATDRANIIHQPVLNPEDPSISLVFSNQATLTRLSPSQLALPPATDQSSPTPLVTNIENYRLADMLITNLENPLSLTPPAAEKKAKSDAAVEAGLGTETDRSESSGSEAIVPEASPTEADSLNTGELNTGETETAETAPADQTDPAQETAAEPTDTAGAETDIAAESSDGEKSDDAKKVAPFMPQELLANGVDVVNIANDAILSNGATQLTDTLNLLQQNQIHAVGAGQTVTDARRPQVFEVKGKRIAYLGYTDSSPRAVSPTSAGVNVGVNQQMQEDIKAIRDQVDWVVVNFNWNRELRAYPEDWQVSLAHAAIDQGADLVVGYHPTVTQGGEIYNGRAIVYSLGNSVDEASDGKPGNYDVAALKVTLKDHMMDVEFLPIQVRQGQAEVAKGDLGSKILQYVEQASSLFDNPLRSPTSLNSQLRLSLPSAPDAQMPTDPFISYPESPIGPTMEPKASP